MTGGFLFKMLRSPELGSCVPTNIWLEEAKKSQRTKVYKCQSYNIRACVSS